VKILFDGTITLRDIAELVNNENFNSNESEIVDWLNEVQLPKDLQIPKSDQPFEKLIQLSDKKYFACWCHWIFGSILIENTFRCH